MAEGIALLAFLIIIPFVAWLEERKGRNIDSLKIERLRRMQK